MKRVRFLRLQGKWQEHPSQLLIEEFEWDKDGLSSADPILSPAVRIKGRTGEEGNQ